MSLRFALILISAALIAPAGFTQDQKPPTLDELVAKNIEAKGGADALRALQSLKLTGKMLVQQGQIELAYDQTKKRPGEVRTDATLQGMTMVQAYDGKENGGGKDARHATLQGMTMVQAYDGKEGWKIWPFQGRKEPEKMSADDVKSLIEDAEIDGPLVDWKAKQSTLEYLGNEDVDGTA